MDLTVPEWLHEVNSKVFFWVSEDRLAGLLNSYGDRHHDVLVLDTRALLATHGDQVLLTTMNTGAVSRFPSCPRRGRDSFMTVADFPYGERCTTDSRRTRVVEVAVDGGVRDVADLVLRVERRRCGGLGKVVWKR